MGSKSSSSAGRIKVVPEMCDITKFSEADPSQSSGGGHLNACELASSREISNLMASRSDLSWSMAQPDVSDSAHAIELKTLRDGVPLLPHVSMDEKVEGNRSSRNLALDS